jgi:fructokinase
VVGEVLWDHFPTTARLGGAPLNFAAHLSRLKHRPLLFSAVGSDAPGIDARRAIHELGLDVAFLQSTSRFATGHARVHAETARQVSFTIERPAAYDAIELTDTIVQQLVTWSPAWVYYGTLFPAWPHAHDVLSTLLAALPTTLRFYDMNVRPGVDRADLIDELLQRADVVKLNEEELVFVHKALGLPADPEAFCRTGSERYQWRAACVTLGDRGCAMSVGDEFVTVDGLAVDVVDTVGAGDAFASAFLHGLVSEWPVRQIAEFSNRIGALVAGVHGAIPHTRDAVVER